MIEWWQHIPEHINPIVFTVGFFSLYWYSLFFLAGFLGVLLFLQWLVKKEQRDMKRADVYDLCLDLFLGALIGGRLGFVLLYRPDIFLNDPFKIIWPYDGENGVWIGLSGMSFHGGLIGAVIALFLFVRRRGGKFWERADLVALATPIALFFGRVGNFLNQELYGRVTEQSWGMYFPFADTSLRHPSALYEAALEGVVLFLVLFLLRRNRIFHGGISALFLVFYGAFRFVAEYVREPDFGSSLVAGFFTLGQTYSGVMMLVGAVLFMWLRQKNRDTLKS